MKRYLTTTFKLGVALTKRFFRDPIALFFTFLFPLLFLFVFGSLFRGDSNIDFSVAVINRSETPFAQKFVEQAKQNKALEVKEDLTDLETAKVSMGRGEIDSILELPQDFGQLNEQGLPSGKLGVYFEESNPQTGQTLGSIMQQVLDDINTELTQQTDPFTVEQKSTKTANLTQFDYTFSGLLGFSILSLGIFGMATSFPMDKKAGILRRLRATPLRASQLISATALNYLVVGVLSIALMFAVGLTIFGLNMRGDYVALTVFILLGIILMFGFGLAIGGWAKNENQASPLSNLIAFPMMFLSGSFFPRFLMPEWLQNITTYLPLTPIIDGIRLIMTEGKTLLDLGPQLLIMGVWIIVIYFIAIKVFRWE